MQIIHPYIIIIFGPTAVGKTDFSLELAAQVSGEIINMDVGQLYSPLSIGTAKPDWQTSNIKHHLFDIIDNPDNYNSSDYTNLLKNIIDPIFKRGNIPILVGGSGFYLKSILYPISSPDTQHIDLDKLYKSDSNLWQELFSIDPDRANKIEKNDMYRIQRALSLWHSTGKKPSTLKPEYNPMYNIILVCLERNLDELNSRINERVEKMIQQGWIQETKKIVAQQPHWKDFLIKKKLIGYDDLLYFLDTNQSLQEKLQCIQKIQQKTRQYAKRQRTFLKMIKNELSFSQTYDKVRKHVVAITIDLSKDKSNLNLDSLKVVLTEIKKHTAIEKIEIK